MGTGPTEGLATFTLKVRLPFGQVTAGDRPLRSQFRFPRPLLRRVAVGRRTCGRRWNAVPGGAVHTDGAMRGRAAVPSATASRQDGGSLLKRRGCIFPNTPLREGLPTMAGVARVVKFSPKRIL